MRIGEGALQGVIFSREPGGEQRQVDLHDFDAAHVESGKIGRAAHDMQRRALRVPASVNTNNPVANSNTANVIAGGFFPGSSQRNNPRSLVQRRKQRFFQCDDDALAQTRHVDHAFADDLAERRNRSTQYERTEQPRAIQALAKNALLEAFDIHRDVGQFGHDVLAAVDVAQSRPKAPNVAPSASSHSGWMRMVSMMPTVAMVTARALHVLSAVRARM